LEVLKNKVYIYIYISKSNRNWYHDDQVLEDLWQADEGDICIKMLIAKLERKTQPKIEAHVEV